jgi:hypothetical protein
MLIDGAGGTDCAVGDGAGVDDETDEEPTDDPDGGGAPSVALAELSTAFPDGDPPAAVVCDSPRSALSGPRHASAEHPPVVRTRAADDATATTRAPTRRAG